MDRKQLWLGVSVVLLALVITLIGIFALSAGSSSSYSTTRSSSSYDASLAPVVFAQQYNSAPSTSSSGAYATPCNSQVTGYVNNMPQRECVGVPVSVQQERDGGDTSIYVSTYNYGGYQRYSYPYRYYGYYPSYRYYPHYARYPYYGNYGYRFNYY